MQNKKNNKKFWNKEYDKKYGKNNKGGNGNARNLAISTKPSSDLIKFLKWFDKYDARHIAELSLGAGSYVYDIGCGNGRNLIYLAKEFGMAGSGFDISAQAIETAIEKSVGLELEYTVHAMDGTIDLPDNSVDLVLDMMASHFLDAEGRERLRYEIARVLKPGGWLFYKTFLLEGDLHAKKMLKKYPTDEKGSYIHPHMGVAEHVSTIDEIIDDYGQLFKIHKMVKSHNHIKNGKAHKRRSVSVYCEKACK